VPPEQIKVEIPVKYVFDFTKRSKNYRLMKHGNENREEYEFERRCDSKIEPGDLEKLEAELKKK
jgi:hypothetical protein